MTENSRALWKQNDAIEKLNANVHQYRLSDRLGILFGRAKDAPVRIQIKKLENVLKGREGEKLYKKF
jgi:hypothetical protein